MSTSESRFSTKTKANLFWYGLAIFALLCFPGRAYPTCTLGGIITTDSTITGTCTLVKDLYISPTANVTIVPPCTLKVAPLADSAWKNLGNDTLRLEILVAGGFRIAGNSGPNGRVVIRSNRTPSGNAGDWSGIVRVASTAKIIVNYAELLDGDITFYTDCCEHVPYIRSDTVANSRFENWQSRAIGIAEGPSSAQSILTPTRDSLVIQGNVFLGGNIAIEFTHDFGTVIDNNQFQEQESIAVFLNHYIGKVTNNYISTSNGLRGIQAFGKGGCDCPDSTIIVGNTVDGYYTDAHIKLGPSITAQDCPMGGFHLSQNKLITGNGTLRSRFGLRAEPLCSVQVIKIRNCLFTGFDSASILSYEFGTINLGSTNDSGKNVFILPCKPTAKAIIGIPGLGAITAIGNWYGTDTLVNADSLELFAGSVPFRPYLKVPTIPIFGHLGAIRDTVTLSWAPGTYTLEGDFTVGSCAKLALKPGVKILAKPNQDILRSGGDTTKCEFRVKGTLTSLGGPNAADSILFTSAATTPANGDWSGVVIDSFGRANFEFTLFKYADTALAVRGDTATVVVYNSTFKNFDKAAVSSRSAKTRLGGIVPLPNPPDCGRNNFWMSTASSGAKAVIKSTSPGGTLKAEGNWWDAVPPPSSYFSGSVDRTPYLAAEATPDSCNANGAFSQPPPEERISVRPSVPISFELGQNYPNPFNPTATIEYALPEPANVELRIFNILGQVIRTLVEQEQPVGYHQAVWDGRDESGRPVSTGIYLYQIKAGDFVETKKMQLIK